MSSSKPLLVVLGATGNQGGSVINHFLSLTPSPYSLRAVTRDPSSPKALLLSSRNVEVVSGDFNDPQSLDAAFVGASVIFSVTDFMSLINSPELRADAAAANTPVGFYVRDYEAQQNRNIIDAAAKVSTLERFIFSGLPNSEKLSGGKYKHVYHSDGKAIAEEYGKEKYPELWEKTSVFYAGFYLENLLGDVGAVLRPKLNKSNNTLIASNAEPLTTLLFPWYSAVHDTGSFISTLLRAQPGTTLIGINEWLSLQDISRLLAQVLEKSIAFTDSAPSFGVGDAVMQKDRMEMLGFSIEFGFYGGKVDDRAVEKEGLGVEVQLKSVREWLEGQDWESLIPLE